MQPDTWNPYFSLDGGGIWSINWIYSRKESLRFLVKSLSGLRQNMEWISSSSVMQLSSVDFKLDKKKSAIMSLLEICLLSRLTQHILAYLSTVFCNIFKVFRYKNSGFLWQKTTKMMLNWMALLYHHFENGCFMADSQTVLDIRDDLGATMNECREVTEKYRTGRSAYLRLGQLFMRLFAGLL